MTPSPRPALDPPHIALSRLLAAVRPVGDERVALADAGGRAVAQAVTADRDSPPHDVSAMDGYAARLADLRPGVTLRVSAESPIGTPPPPMTPGCVVQVSTGACIPAGAEAVIRREHVEEAEGEITLRRESPDASPGANIRRRGENAPPGRVLLTPGTPLGAGAMATLAALGVAEPRVYRRVRVGVLVTGDELRNVGDAVEPWQIRDSNGPALAAALSITPWINLLPIRHVGDDADATRDALASLVGEADVVLTTGGVSRGDHDHVPDAVRAVGGRVVYHGLSMRPGKPNLGGWVGGRGGEGGCPVLGLPGNPVAVLCGLTRLAWPVLRAVGGFADPLPPRPRVQIVAAEDRTLGLWWYRPCRLDDEGRAVLLPHRGSGDVAAAAGMEGFVEFPPDTVAEEATLWPMPGGG